MLGDFQITPHISFHELTNTDSLVLLEKNREYGFLNKDKLFKIASILELVRVHFGFPVIVHSCVRCPELNSLLKGVPNSQHLLCEAVDFHISNTHTLGVFNWIWQDSGIKFGQLIHEIKPSKFNGVVEWIHLSLGEPFRPSNKCNEVLNYKDGKYSWVSKK